MERDQSRSGLKAEGLAVSVDDSGKTLGGFLNIDPARRFEVLRGLASPVRVDILKLLRRSGSMNVNQISEALDLPQSTIASNILILQEAGLVDTHTVKAAKGQQKLCSAPYGEVVISLDEQPTQESDGVIEVDMPLGLYTSCSVSAPCGLCSTQGVIGVLDVPERFLDPSRMQAALIWFGRGFVEYKFPNNAKLLGAEVEAIEFCLELSSETPGTNSDWPSDISLWVNDARIGTWTSSGDHGDKRGQYTPQWWKLEGSQYGDLVTWVVSNGGTSVNGRQVSEIALPHLALDAHHSIRLKIGIDEEAIHPGGVNVFGKGFGNHDQGIVMRLHLKRD